MTGGAPDPAGRPANAEGLSHGAAAPDSSGRAAAAGQDPAAGPATAENPFRDFSLLPADRTFARLFPAFFLPYAAYVGLGALPAVAPEIIGVLRILIVGALLWGYRARYRFGPGLAPRLGLLSVPAALAALALWVACYRLSLALPWWRAHDQYAQDAATPSGAYWILRALNSALLVPVFEDLFCRAYLGQFFASLRGPGGFGARLGARFDAQPEALQAPPLGASSLIGSTLCFTAGHDPSAFIPAASYFLFTSWLYARTRSFRFCIAVHGLVNFAIAAIVWHRPALQFLWF